MPRQDVPYPTGAICRLRERIGELFDLLGQKLHSINGVEGDGQGNVTIKSGDPAVIINNDQAQHEIEIALDSSQLPAAAVSSVNGQTGAVALTADDIPSDNGDVQTDIDNLEAADTTLQGNINAEALARQNADSTLQTNINAVMASIPDMSVTPDPYKGVERDAQGRAFAADPTSGATDKTLTTANWISQTGDSGPNNLIHKTGAETKTGAFTLPDAILGYLSAGRIMYAGPYSQTYVTKLGHMTKPSSNFALYMTILIRDRRNGHICLWNPWVARTGGTVTGGSNKIADDNSYTFGIVITMDSNDVITMWTTIPRLDVNVLSIEFANNNVEASAHFTADDTSIQYPALDPADYDIMVSV